MVLGIHGAGARVSKVVCSRAESRITRGVVAGREVGRRTIARDAVVRDAVRIVGGGREEERRLAGDEARLLQRRLRSTVGGLEMIQGQGASVSHCVVHGAAGPVRGTRTAHGLAVTHALGHGRLLDAAVQRVCDHSTPGQDTHAEEAEDGGDADEDGALWVGRLLHEGRIRKIGHNHRGNAGAGQGWQASQGADGCGGVA